ncbi:hypothetical protein GUJ93_ZPchr0006g44899 [Zizania palustris]|uniref:HMA domain-containing protein n=1 Tax=Zizania palustris TaxID=103762 RepID=A0A8J5W2J7_ZIZPA|nr:hypothetical protein GUJ93_ZPchr0006g44899 [Zizania palustris]
MGDEKAPSKGGAEPVVLRMELHCAGCAQKVKKSIKHFAGVESVVADLAANRVIVTGTADAAALRARIEAKTQKSVEIVSAAGGGIKKAAAEPKADKDAGGGGKKKGDKDTRPEEEKGKKQSSEEKKPKEETVLLKIPLHCDGCANRIRRRIYKIKGVKDVVMEGNAKDEVKVSGTMDVPAMVVYLTNKLNRAVEAVAPGKKDGGGEKKDKGGDGDKKKDAPAAAAAAGGDDKKDKGKSIEVVGPSTAAAAASMAPAPAEASTYHVSPYGHVPYPQQVPPPSYYLYYGGNADGVGYAYPNAGATYYHPQPQPDDGLNQQPYQPYPYHIDMSPPSQMFSDENPNACSVM